MEFIRVKFLAICSVLLIVSSVYGDLQVSCRHNVSFKINVEYDQLNCKSGCLTSVKDVQYSDNKNNCEYWLLLEDEYFNAINSGAFKNLIIDGLVIHNERDIFLNAGFLNGLSNLQYLVINTAHDVFLIPSIRHEEKVFPINNRITHLEYPLNSVEKIKNVLPAFPKLKKLKLNQSPVEIYDNIFPIDSSSLTQLEFDVSNSVKIYSKAFSHLKNLTELKFTNTKIDHLEIGAFYNLDKLESLIIWLSKKSETTKISNNIFVGLAKIDTIEIRMDEPSNFTIIDNTFSGMKINNLDLKNLYIGRINNRIFNGLDVENLHIRPNQMDEIAHMAFQGSNVRNLHYWGNVIKNFNISDLKKFWGFSTNTQIIARHD